MIVFLRDGHSDSVSADGLSDSVSADCLNDSVSVEGVSADCLNDSVSVDGVSADDFSDSVSADDLSDSVSADDPGAAGRQQESADRKPKSKDSVAGLGQEQYSGRLSARRTRCCGISIATQTKALNRPTFKFPPPHPPPPTPPSPPSPSLLWPRKTVLVLLP